MNWKNKKKTKTEYEKALEKEPWLKMLDPIQYYEYMSNKPENIRIDEKEQNR